MGFTQPDRMRHVVTGSVREYAEIGVDGTLCPLFVLYIELLQSFGYPRECFATYIVAVWLQECAQELHTLMHLTDMEFTHVQLQAQFVGKELSLSRHLTDKPLTVWVYLRGVIDISAIVTAKDVALDELVEWIQIDVAK